MDYQRFDNLSRALAQGTRPLDVLKGLLGTVVGDVFGTTRPVVPVQAFATSTASDPCQCYLQKNCPPPSQQSCIIQTYPTQGTRFIVNEPLKADIEFFPALDQINACAAQNNVYTLITSAFRACEKQADIYKKRNKKVKASNHLIGHAIDMNVRYFDANGSPHLCDWKYGTHTGCLAQPFNNLPVPVQNFITCVRNSGLRWGGIFVDPFPDPVHFDDDWYHKNQSAWQAKLDAAQTSVFPCPNNEPCTNGICGCPDGLTMCDDGSCVDTLNDPLNCGDCGTVCSGGNMCSNGTCISRSAGTCPGGMVKCLACRLEADEVVCVTRCVPSSHENCFMCGRRCSAVETCCKEGCANLQTDNQHCGRCDIECRDTQVCVNGKCVCPPGETFCGGQCVDLQSNDDNCGVCGNSCPTLAGQYCCQGTCNDYQSDDHNCGSCGHACTNGHCEQGQCICLAGQVLCPNGPNDQCVNLQGDDQHCGTCGNACPAGQHCCQGMCVDYQTDDQHCGSCATPCPAGLHCCHGVCVDYQSNDQHCGSCGHACTNGHCQQGKCVCPPGQNVCPIGSNDQCVNLQGDDQHCGTCGNACPAGQHCCQGMCVDYQTDDQHCGSCATPCPAGLHCCHGVCIDYQTSSQNCGGCDHTCTGGQFCRAGQCVCQQGLSFCNGMCVDVQTNNQDCGGCGHACIGGQLCSNGQCICAKGWTFCNGMCVDLQSNDQHCSSCGHICPAGQHCCHGMCIDFQFNSQNCGSCGHACPAGQKCCSGYCTNTMSDPNNCGICGNSVGACGVCVNGCSFAICPGNAIKPNNCSCPYGYCCDGKGNGTCCRCSYYAPLNEYYGDCAGYNQPENRATQCLR